MRPSHDEIKGEKEAYVTHTRSSTKKLICQLDLLRGVLLPDSVSSPPKLPRSRTLLTLLARPGRYKMLCRGTEPNEVKHNRQDFCQSKIKSLL